MRTYVRAKTDQIRDCAETVYSHVDEQDSHDAVERIAHLLHLLVDEAAIDRLTTAERINTRSTSGYKEF